MTRPDAELSARYRAQRLVTSLSAWVDAHATPNPDGYEYGDLIDFRAFGMWMHLGCFAIGHVSRTGQIGFESGKKGYIRSLPPHRIRHHVEGTE